ncbi:MAG: tetratricopeptide repeat protein [Prevotella sp.]|jgi:tetratricopeptide (TPR) repeat protein|nr:tetratricopeptide repeat protein [Prevotella sp.]
MAKQINQGAPQMEETLSKNEAMFLKYQKQIIAAVAAVVIIVAGCIIYHHYVAVPSAQKASTALAKGQQYFQNEDYLKALNGDSIGFVGFLKIAEEGGDAGNLANLYAGLSYAQLDSWSEAVKYLEKFDQKDDAMISPAMIGALGNAYAHIDQLDKAVSLLKEAAAKADNNSLSPTFLIQAGEILESQNKKDEALKLYQEVKDKYFNSMAYQTIDAYIERASAK